LDKMQSEELHSFVAKSLLACKRARPDLHTTTTFLCTRVKLPTQDDCTKLFRLMTYLNGSRDEVLFLSADDLHVIKWYALLLRSTEISRATLVVECLMVQEYQYQYPESRN
jgi:hypothetical protein